MKALTIHNHPASESDFCWGVEGEIAYPTPPAFFCTQPNCGCDRSHSGLNSHQASTTVMVRDVDLDFDDLADACVGSIEAAGWATLFEFDAEALARQLVAAGAEIADQYTPGTILRPVFDHDRDEWRYTEVTEP